MARPQINWNAEARRANLQEFVWECPVCRKEDIRPKKPTPDCPYGQDHRGTPMTLVREFR